MKNNEMKTMTLEEMNKAAGGGAVHNSARRKIREKIVNWICSWFN